MYQDPTADLDSYATITIRNVSSWPFAARLYEDALTCTGPVFFTPEPREMKHGDARTFRAKKGEPFTIGAWYVTWKGRTKRQCDLNTTFVPTAATYEIAYDADDGLENCSVEIAVEENGSKRPLPKDSLVVRGFHLAFADSGPWCQKLSDAHRATLGMGTPAAN